MAADPAAIPPNPRNAAMMAMMKNIIEYRNIIIDF